MSPLNNQLNSNRKVTIEGIGDLNIKIIGSTRTLFERNFSKKEIEKNKYTIDQMIDLMVK